MKSLIQKLKNCEGCKRRRTFLKQALLTVAGFFMFPLRIQATDCEFIICPDGVQAGLCCDDSCTNCSFIHSRYSVTVCNLCNGHRICYGVGCLCCGCPPGDVCVADTKSKEWSWKYYFEVTLSNDAKFLVGTDETDFDPITKINSGHLKLKDKDGNRLTAKSSHKLSSSGKA